MNMRDKILNIASSLFDSRGIQASGVDTIILEAGVAKATLYKHFPSKNQLITAYLRDKSDKFYAWLNAQMASKKVESQELLLLLCELMAQWISQPEFRGLPFHIAAVEFPEAEHPINQSLWSSRPSYRDTCAKLRATREPKTRKPWASS